MKELFRAKIGNGRTQVQYQLEEEEYGWLLYNMAHLLDEVKDTGAELTIAAKVLVDTKSDTNTLNLPGEPIEGMVSEKGVMLGHETVEYQFTVRISVPVPPRKVAENTEPEA